MLGTGSLFAERGIKRFLFFTVCWFLCVLLVTTVKCESDMSVIVPNFFEENGGIFVLGGGGFSFQLFFATLGRIFFLIQ